MASPAPIIRYPDLNKIIKFRDRMQEEYENNNVVLLENTEQKYDSDFLNLIQLPQKAKKIGSKNGICQFPYIFKNNEFILNNNNALTGLTKDALTLAKISYEFLNLESTFKSIFFRIFPKYTNVAFTNCTYRLTPTYNEDMHFDSFNTGSPIKSHEFIKIKFFWNISKKPRIWNVGPTLFDYLVTYRDRLPDTLPDDINVLTNFINNVGNLKNIEKARLEIPPNAIILANGWTIAHQVVEGTAMVALEAAVSTSNTIKKRSESDILCQFLAENNFSVTNKYDDFSKK